MERGMIENQFENQYKEMLYNITRYGNYKDSRAGETIFLPNQILTFDCHKGKAPVITGKKIYVPKALAEFKWMWLGDTNIKYLNDHGIKWWNEYANDKGDLGKIYGYQVRSYCGTTDQVRQCYNKILEGSRRAVILFYNTSEEDQMSLPPCYISFTYMPCFETKRLHGTFHLRSSDTFLGLPYDMIIGYLFLKEMAERVNLDMGEIMYVLSDAHVYRNHFKPVNRYLKLPHYSSPFWHVALDMNHKSGPFIQANLNH